MPVQIRGGVRRSGVVADMNARISAAFTAGMEVLADQIRGEWSGWQHPTGRSQAGWRSIPTEARGSVLTGGVENPVPYVPYVHRRGQGVPAIDQIARNLLPAAEDRLRAALTDAAASTPLTEGA